VSAHLTGWLMVAAGTSITLGIGILLAARRRQDREWAATAAERVQTAEYLWWLEGEFIAMDAGDLP
jgi:hypothetical protein